MEEIPQISAALSQIEQEAHSFFQSAAGCFDSYNENEFHSYRDAEHFWSQLDPTVRAASSAVQTRLISVGKTLALLCKSSVLVEQADLRDLVYAVKRMRSALRLRQYEYTKLNVVHDEGMVLGVEPPTQEERWPLHPTQALEVFDEAFADVVRVFELSDESGRDGSARQVIGGDDLRYRPNTAFLMMWMDPNQPGLDDVRDAVRVVFKAFGIQALRADEIEHSGMITQRILDEIRTSEFLFADLSGMRPNVYYEIGYAHALGKRVILFRRAGTELHFDLAGYNCPEYRNLAELREKLTRRLESLTNRALPT